MTAYEILDALHNAPTVVSIHDFIEPVEQHETMASRQCCGQ